MSRKEPSAFEIAPGGLRSSAEIKILICYLLGAVRQPLPRQAIDEVFLEHRLANYFDVSDALQELTAAGAITRQPGGEEVYALTESGRSSAALLETTLPISVREKVVPSAMRLLTRRRNERENRVTVDRTAGGYAVTCAVLDGELELMSTRLLVADEMQADLIKNAFLRDPLRVYQSVITLLTEEETNG